MKGYHALILLVLITYIYSAYSDKYYCDSTKYNNPTKADDCKAGNHDGGYCCFVKSKLYSRCRGFSPNEYKTIVDQVKIGKKCDLASLTDDDCSENEDYSIDCKSSYLAFGSLALLLLFF